MIMITMKVQNQQKGRFYFSLCASCVLLLYFVDLGMPPIFHRADGVEIIHGAGHLVNKIMYTCCSWSLGVCGVQML